MNGNQVRTWWLSFMHLVALLHALAGPIIRTGGSIARTPVQIKSKVSCLQAWRLCFFAYAYILSSVLPPSSDEPSFRRRKRFQMTVTSDYRGFAGVQTPATHPPPPSILSSELKFLAHGYIPMRARFIGADVFLR